MTDPTTEIRKWLNEEPNRPIDRVALAEVLAAHDRLRAEVEQLRGFAKAVMGNWPDVGGLDGFDLQEMGEKHGLLERLNRTVPCSELCNCVENVATGETTVCYRLTSLVKGGAMKQEGK